MASEGSQLDCNVTVYFVIPAKYKTEDQCGEDMWHAYNKCVDYDLKPQWITCEECNDIKPVKSDIFVMEEFEGEVFETLKKYKCSIVGPRCLLICFNNGEPIPEGTSPVFTTAMRNVCICVSGLSPDEKDKLHKLVEYMGGFYTKPLRSCVTHLVTDSVMSAKYESAVGMKIPIVTKEWVNAIWEANLKEFIRASDKTFDKYRCPVFMHLVVTSTNLPKRQKEEIKRLINDHGGTFMGPLDGSKVRIVVALENSPLSEKLKYAMQNNIACLKPDWVYESVKLGYALPFNNFLIKSTKACSTPEKNRENVSFNFSTVSTIPCEVQRHYMDESVTTMLGDTSTADQSTSVTSNCPKIPTLERLTLSDAKVAGPFLDGCNIYLAGFAPNQRDKLNRILNVGSATRFDEISDALTHVLVGDENKASNELKVIKSKGLGPYILTLDWLEESMKLKRPAAEESFLFGEKNDAAKALPAEPPSPLSKKNLQMLQRPRRPTVSSFDIDRKMPSEMEEDADDLVQQYLQKPDMDNTVREFLSRTVQERLKSQEDVLQAGVENVRRKETASIERTSYAVPMTTEIRNSNLENDSAIPLSQGSAVMKIFEGLTFVVTGANDEENDVIESITSLGGRIVPQLFTGVPDFGIVPIVGAPLRLTVNEIVTNLYIEDCVNEEKIVDVEYYHRPLSVIKGLNPLSKCVITISMYTGVERAFLGVLATELGAMFQDTFARKTNAERNTYASTHLICPTPEGNKYNAAVKWKLPAVTADWLKACADQSKLVDETPFLVGETMAPERGRLNDTSEGSAQRLNESQMAPPHTPAERQIIVPKRNLPQVQNENDSSTGQTPLVNKRLSLVMNNTPPSPFHVATPDTPYGQIFKSNPSPDTRKGWKKWVDNFPDLQVNEPAPKRKRPSTPLSELKKQLWQKLKDAGNEEEVPKRPELAEPNNSPVHQVQQEMQQLKESNKQQPNKEGTPSINRKLTFADENSPFRNNQINLQLAQLEEALQRTSSTPESRHSSGENARKYDTQESVTDIQKCLVKDSQPDTVGWEDPSHRMPFRPSTIAEKPSDKKLQPAETTQEEPYIEADNESLEEPEPPPPQPTPKPKFMLSGMKDRTTYEQVIRELGGDVSADPNFDGTATHLLCTRPSRNEKMLGSIASGKWVLHCSYLRDSEQEGKFIDEELYEWGNPKSKNIIPDPKGETEQAIAAAAYRWRLNLTSDSRGPFHGMVALLLVSEDKFDQFRRLIEAGGGSVQQARPPYDASPSGRKITHCFVNVKQVNQPIDWAMLASKGILCFLPQYLSDHLTASTPLNPREFVLPDFRKYLTLLPR